MVAGEGTDRRENQGERERRSGKAGGWLTRKLQPLPRGLYFGDPILQVIGLCTCMCVTLQRLAPEALGAGPINLAAPPQSTNLLPSGAELLGSPPSITNGPITELG